jgi:hypothetical protein
MEDKVMKRFSVSAMLALVAIVMVGTAAFAQSKVVTFDNGTEGWTANPDFEEIRYDDEHGNYWNFTNIEYGDGTTIYHTRGWYDVWNDNDPAFIGDYTQKGEVRICVDVNVNIYDFFSWFGGWMRAEQWREVAIVLRDNDMQYQDPDWSMPMPWAEAQFFVDYLQSRDDGWVTYCADVTDVDSFELPAGWSGFGGGEDPDTYMPIFPPGYGWRDLLAGVDEIRINSVLHGWFYSLNFVHDLDFDNISIGPIPCADQEPTVFVSNGIVHGGPLDGKQYNGVLKGTAGDDVIAGTGGNDTILGFAGNDLICGRGGNDQIEGLFGDDMIDGGAGDDTINGQQGNDFLNGGEGRDNMNGGPGDDTCVGGEVFNSCGMASASSPGDSGGIESAADSLPPSGGLVNLDGGPVDPASGASSHEATEPTRRVLESRRGSRAPRSR